MRGIESLNPTDLSTTTSKVTDMMQAIYSFPNQAWIVYFGDNPVGIGPYNQSIFNSKDDLVSTLDALNLELEDTVRSYTPIRNKEND